MLESPAGGGAGPAERRGVSSAASGRRAARATVAGLPAAGRGAPRRRRAEGAARAACRGLHRAARARGPQPCLVSGLITAAPAGRPACSGGPPGKTGQERLGAPPGPWTWAPPQGHRAAALRRRDALGPTQASARSTLQAGSRPRSEVGPSPAWPRGSEGNEGAPHGFLERSIPAGRTPLPATQKTL